MSGSRRAFLKAANDLIATTITTLAQIPDNKAGCPLTRTTALLKSAGTAARHPARVERAGWMLVDGFGEHSEFNYLGVILAEMGERARLGGYITDSAFERIDEGRRIVEQLAGMTATG